jgi:hypothetical protein
VQFNVSKAMQVPVAPPDVQPGQLQPAHDWHDTSMGVPVQLGTWNSVGADGKRPIVPQQMRSLPMVQSLSDVHSLGQLELQMPPQQRGAWVEPLQSESVVHALGQAAA